MRERSKNLSASGGGIRAVWRRHWLAFVLAGVILAPSLVTLPIPILSEDPLSIRTKPIGKWFSDPWFFFCDARILGRFYITLLLRPLAYPVKAWLVQSGVFAGLALFCFCWYHFARVITGRRRVGAWLMFLPFLHFAFIDSRFFNGHQSLIAITLQLLGFLGAYMAVRNGGRLAYLKAGLLVLVYSFAALNFHQAGAFVFCPILALVMAARMLYPHNPRKKLLEKALLVYAVGIVLSGLFYFAEILIIEHMGDMVRTESSLLPNLKNFFYLAPVASFAALPGWVLENPQTHLVLFFAFVVASAIYPARLSWWRRLLIPVLIFLGSMMSFLPILATEGYLSCRVMFPWILGIYGGMGLVLFSRERFSRSMVFRWGLVLLAACLYGMHLWCYALIHHIKREDFPWTRRLHRELMACNPQAEESVGILCRPWISRYAGWGDMGRSLFATPWGCSGVLASESISDSPLPDPLYFYLADDWRLYQAYMDDFTTRLAGRLENGQLFLEGDLVRIRQIEIDYIYSHPWADEIELHFSDLDDYSVIEAPCANPAPLVNVSGKETVMQMAPGVPNIRIYFWSLQLNRPWRFEAKTHMPDMNPDARFIHRVGLRFPDGHDAILADISAAGNINQWIRLEQEQAHPEAVLWIESILIEGLIDEETEIQWKHGRVFKKR